LWSCFKSPTSPTQLRLVLDIWCLSDKYDVQSLSQRAILHPETVYPTSHTSSLTVPRNSCIRYPAYAALKSELAFNALWSDFPESVKTAIVSTHVTVRFDTLYKINELMLRSAPNLMKTYAWKTWLHIQCPVLRQAPSPLRSARSSHDPTEGTLVYWGKNSSLGMRTRGVAAASRR
jgi:hypothetical protein